MALDVILSAFGMEPSHSVLSDMGGIWVVALVALAGITIKWVPFHSQLYPYTISQPSSYQHEPIQNTSRQKTDFFFPALGSSVTNVNVYCDHANPNPITYLQSIRGKQVHRSEWLTIMRKRYPVIQADFSGLRERWTEERVTVPIRGWTCHLTASYAHRHRNQRPIMMKMLSSFRSP